MQLELGIEEVLQEFDVEQVPADGVVLRDGIAELDGVIVHRRVDSSVVEEVGQIIVQEIHQVLEVLALSLLD